MYTREIIIGLAGPTECSVDRLFGTMSVFSGSDGPLDSRIGMCYVRVLDNDVGAATTQNDKMSSER